MVGDPHDRLREDGLRLIRIFRFVSQLGFNIDPKTLRAVPFHFDVFKKVAKERINTEFQRLLQGSFFQKGLFLLEECGLLYQIIPEFSHDEFQNNVPNLETSRIKLTMNIISNLPRTSSPRLRFAALIHQITVVEMTSDKLFPPFRERPINDLMKRLKFIDKQIVDVVHILSIHLLPLPYFMEEKTEEEKDYLIRKFQYKIRPEYLQDYLMFYETKEKALEKEIRLTKELQDNILERANANG